MGRGAEEVGWGRLTGSGQHTPSDWMEAVAQSWCVDRAKAPRDVRVLIPGIWDTDLPWWKGLGAVNWELDFSED